MIADWIITGIEALFGALIVIIGIYAFRLGRVMQARVARVARAAQASTAQPKDPIADLLEAKAAIRMDERRRWAEAWQRAAALPDLSTTILDIQQVQQIGVAEHRKLQAERARVAAVEAAEAERAAHEARIARLRDEADREAAAERAHQAHLAARRARYAQRRSSR